MRIEHLALWTTKLERLKAFYERFFNARSGDKYVNQRTGFESYFLTFPGGGPRLEIMRRPALEEGSQDLRPPAVGLAHFAISVGSEARVNGLTTELSAAGFPVLDGPRRTGDGYYESVVLDPDGNRVEIAA